MTSSTAPQPLFRHGEPAFTHDCTDCHFLGTVDRLDSRQITEDIAEVDLYAHTDPRAGNAVVDVIARYGNEPNQTITGQSQRPWVVAMHPEPHLTAAAERAIQLGMMPG